MLRSQITKHLVDTHLVKVVADNGETAFAYDCPECGMSAQAWGHDTDVYRWKLSRAEANLSLHLSQRHSVDWAKLD